MPIILCNTCLRNTVLFMNFRGAIGGGSKISIQMKKLLLLSTLFLTGIANFSCKKAIEKKQEDLVVEAMTNGICIVQQYFEAANNISSQFADYDFQFYKDGNVTGTKSGNITNGTWSGNASNY